MNKSGGVVIAIMVMVFPLLLIATPARAIPITIDFTYSGGSGTSATGSIVFNTDYLLNPTGLFQSIALDGTDPTVNSLMITYAGFTNPAYNKTFYMADFAGMNWDTHNTLLDFSQQLIGQTTYDPMGNPDGTWGPGSYGEFSFVSAFLGNPLYPQYSDYFALAYGGEVFTMGSLQQETPPVPEPGTILLLGSGLLGLVPFRKRFMKKAA